MKAATEALWTNEDFLQEKCSVKDIGKPIPLPDPVDEPSALLEALPAATMAELKQAALRVARGKMGYDEFLAKNPQFHQKFLLSMAKEQVQQERPTVEVNISWLQPERLSYKNASPLDLVQEVDRVQDVEPIAWKEPEIGLADTMRHHVEKPT